MKNRSIYGMLLLFTLFTQALSANHPESNFYIYGKVHTTDNTVFEGYITWGTSKYLWTDIFRANKLNNPYSKYFSRGNQMVNGNIVNSSSVHLFSCRFGNMKSIRPTGINRVEIEMKGGYFIEVKKGQSNDIEIPITIYTLDARETIIKWSNISKVEFFTPASAPETPSEFVPITGIVKTGQGYFKGFLHIVYNNKLQRKINDKLYIYANYAEHAIAFKHIRSIRKKKDYYEIALQDSTILSFSNKSSANSVTVSMPHAGSITIPWNHIESIATIPATEIKTFDFDARPIDRLRGEVSCRNGEKYTGTLVYDLDEALQSEILNGKNNQINYEIPFRFIQSIEPKNHLFSYITFKNGYSVSLGDSQDVNQANDGIMIFRPNLPVVYVPWKEITFIKLLD